MMMSLFYSSTSHLTLSLVHTNESIEFDTANFNYYKSVLFISFDLASVN